MPPAGEMERSSSPCDQMDANFGALFQKSAVIDTSPKETDEVTTRWTSFSVSAVSDLQAFMPFIA